MNDFKMTVAVDIVVLGFQPTELQVLLIRRRSPPFEGCLALPGGRMELTEDADTAALRELQEETGIRPRYLEQLYTFTEPARDPRGRVVSVAYFGLVSVQHFRPKAGSDASEAKWFKVSEALQEQLAFDHLEILGKALARVQGKVRYSPIGFDLLPKQFTIADLRQLYEGILGKPLETSNFRKKILALGILAETGASQTGQHRPAPLYRFDKRAYDLAVKNRFNFEI